MHDTALLLQKDLEQLERVLFPGQEHPAVVRPPFRPAFIFYSRVSLSPRSSLFCFSLCRNSREVWSLGLWMNWKQEGVSVQMNESQISGRRFTGSGGVGVCFLVAPMVFEIGGRLAKLLTRTEITSTLEGELIAVTRNMND